MRDLDTPINPRRGGIPAVYTAKLPILEVEPQMRERLLAMSKKTGRSMAEIRRDALEQALKLYETFSDTEQGE
jgi:predicted DNA-binding protein